MMRCALPFFVFALLQFAAGRECENADVTAFTSQYKACASIANFPSEPSMDDLIRGCKYTDCSQLYKSFTTLPCTLSNITGAMFGQLCSSTKAPTPTPFTASKECTQNDLSGLVNIYRSCTADSGITNLTDSNLAKYCSFTSCQTYLKGYSSLTCTINGKPAKLLSTLCSTPDSGGYTICSSSDFTKIKPVMVQCDAQSGIANLTTTNLPVWCSYPICVQASKLYANLTCKTVSDTFAREFAKVCDKYTNGTITTPAPTSNSGNVGECAASDLPSGYVKQQQACLFAAGLQSVPSSVSGAVALCQYKDCATAMKMYSGLTCTVNGLPATILANICDGVTTTVAPKTPAPASSSTLSVLSLVSGLVVALAWL